MSRTRVGIGDWSPNPWTGRWLVLLVGFLGLLGALAVAHFAPAVGYEVDIYAATPVGFWVGVGVAYASFLVVVVNDWDGVTTSLAVLLGSTATVSVVSLPLVRGYYFYGHTDAMGHLGSARAIESGSLNTLNLVYPGSHSLAVLIHRLTGLELPFSMLFVVLSLAATFVVFVPLTVHVLTGDRQATAAGAFAAFLLLPINNVATELPYFPYLLATFYFPVLLYLFVKHIKAPTVDVGQRLANGRLKSAVRSGSLPTNALVPIAGVSILMFHPQTTMNVVALFSVVLAVQLVVRWRRPTHPIADTRLILGQVIFLWIVFVVWTSHHDATERTAVQVYDSLEGALVGAEGSEFAHTATSRADSAESIGVSLVELFVKLFLTSAVFVVLSGAAVLLVVFDRLEFPGRYVSNVVSFLAVGGLVLLPIFFLHSFGNVSSYMYRHVGFAGVLVSVVGAVGLASLGRRLVGDLRERGGARLEATGRGVAACLAACLLVLALLSVFPSPYIYNPGHQVTEAHLDGYETSFSHKPNVVWNAQGAVFYGGIRSPPKPYLEATSPNFSRERRLIFSGPIPGESLDDLPAYYRTHPEQVVRRDHYLPVTNYISEREVTAYRGFRYTDDELRNVRDQPAVHRIQANGDMSVYYVDIDLYNESASDAGQG